MRQTEPPAVPGLAIRVRRVTGAPVVAIRLWVSSGARIESIPGLAVVTGRMLPEGTAERGWQEIADATENRGMNLSSFGTFEGHGVSIDALAQDWELALDWVAELMLTPSFPEDRCTWTAKQAAGELESMADLPDVKTSWGFVDQLYAPHPRRRPVQGSTESLLSLTPDDCAAFHRRALAHGVTAAVAGTIDEAAVAKRLESLFSHLPKSAEPLPEPPPPVGLPERRRFVATEASDQAHLYAGHLTVPRRHPDYAALELLAVVLGSGAGLTGRIPARIREREGLAYTAQAQTLSAASIDPGRLVAYVGTSPDTVDKAERGVVEEITRLVEDGITDDELLESRAYLLGHEPFRRETARQWADLLLEAEHYGLPLDDTDLRNAELRALDKPTVEAAARRHIHPDRLKVTVGLPAAAAESR